MSVYPTEQELDDARAKLRHLQLEQRVCFGLVALMLRQRTVGRLHDERGVSVGDEIIATDRDGESNGRLEAVETTPLHMAWFNSTPSVDLVIRFKTAKGEWRKTLTNWRDESLRSIHKKPPS